MVVNSAVTPIDKSERPAEGMGGFAKGLAIIEAFASCEVMSVADAARASGATRAAARRCLLTLEKLGYTERIGREFRPLPRMRRLGRSSSLRERLARESQEVLDQARGILNESVSLAVLDGTAVLFIARAEAQHIVSTGVRVGARLPAYCSATGRVLLGHMEDASLLQSLGIEAHRKRTSKTLTTPAAILRQIRLARKSGFAVSDEELEIGLRSLAVPVQDAQRRTIAAVSVSAYTARIALEEFEGPFLDALKAAAAEIERRLALS